MFKWIAEKRREAMDSKKEPNKKELKAKAVEADAAPADKPKKKRWVQFY